MVEFKDLILAVVLAVIGSSGLWTFIQFLITNSRKHKKQKDIADKLDQHEEEIRQIKAMSLGALYDRAKFLGESYLKRGWWTMDEYEDYIKYIYKPYHGAGGDGTIDRLVHELEKMPIEVAKKKKGE